jgi:ubiquinone/menaquinone biosynthesis C-methylase UbiE
MSLVGNIEHSHLAVAGSGDHDAVVAMRHEFHTEDVLGVACGNGRAELELTGVVGWLIAVDVQVLIVATTGEKSACFGP